VTRRRDTLANLLAAGLALLALAASLRTAAQVYEGLPHIEDEFANLWQAEVMAQGALTLPSPAESRYFVVPFVVDHQGLRFGKYPPGWPAVLSLGIRLGAPTLVNALLAGLSVWLTFRLGSRLGGKSVGLLAALLLATSPMVVILSGSMMSHPLSLFLGLVFSLTWLDLFLPSEGAAAPPRVPRWLLWLTGGLSLGLLVVTRPLTALAVAIPFALHGLWLLRCGPGTLRLEVGALAGVAIVVSLLLPLWQVEITGSPLTNPYTLWWSYDRIGFGAGHGPQPGGHSLHWAFINTRFSLWTMQHDLFGWPSLSWLMVPAGLWALRRRLDLWLVLAIFPALVLAYAAYWVGAWLYGPRYYVEALPGLAVASAAGFVWLGRLSERPTSGRVRARRLAVSAMLVALMAVNVGGYLPMRLASLRGLYGIHAADQESFLQTPNRAGKLILVNPIYHWSEAVVLMLLTPPFESSDFLVAWDRDPQADPLLRQAYPDWEVVHYYPDEPGVLRPMRR
jgi:4-amino-4-deoxy-L-arabinose transferase-like glycosyltransferase